MEVQRIEAGAVQSEEGEDVVLLVHEASGDEEVSATGVPLKGVILAHSLPHLSHLGVRARQEKVVFVTCEDKDTMNATLKPLIGRSLSPLHAAIREVVVCIDNALSYQASGRYSSNATLFWT